MTTRVLIVDDDAEIRESLRDVVTDLGYAPIICSGAAEALDVLHTTDVEAVVTDLRMPVVDGLELCERIAANYDIPVVVMTAFGEVRTAAAAMRADAFDFIVKPFTLRELATVLERAVKKGTTLGIRRLAAPEVPQEFAGIVGQSPAMQDLVRHLARIAASDASVLITGESGTGKELIARALHANSSRRGGPFVAVNCAAVPAEMLESELFGHRKGAFTGALENRAGLFQKANGGTLLLDEVGAMPSELQPVLLRALQERAVRAVGSAHEERFDARIVAATNSDLTALVRRGAFREDLLFRLEVLRVEAPPLRERAADVPALARHFLEEHVKRGGRVLTLSDGALEALAAYPWPGNVRELQNCLESAAALVQGDRIEFADLPAAVRAAFGKGASLEALQREHIENVLDAVGGNIAHAARVLGIDRGTLYRRLKRVRRARGDESGGSDRT